MFPNININDRVLVLKDKLFDIDYSVGDVIVFYSPESSIPNNSNLLVENLKIWELVNSEGNNNQTVYSYSSYPYKNNNLFEDSS